MPLTSYSKCSFSVIIWLLFGDEIVTFIIKPLVERTQPTFMNTVTVAGDEGGIAESIAYKLTAAGSKVLTIFNSRYVLHLDGSTVPPVSRAPQSNPQLQNAFIAVVTDDSGPNVNANNFQFEDSILDPAVNAVVSILRLNGGQTAVPKFGSPSRRISQFCEKQNVPYIELQYDELIGGIPGAEPIPFRSMPLIEPELHPSYVLQTVVCDRDNSRVTPKGTVCTRDGMAELVVQIVRMLEQQKERSRGKIAGSRLARSLRVRCIAGPPLDQMGWDTLLRKSFMGTPQSEAELLRIELTGIMKPQSLLTWVCDSWFPQAAAEADAARVFSAARPIRAVQTGPNTVAIYWEEILPDLTVRPSGTLEVQLGGLEVDNGGLVVGKLFPSVSLVRTSPTLLPGEVQLVTHFEKAIKKLASKKQLCRL